MSKKNKVLNEILVIAIILSCLLGSIHFNCFNTRYYTKQHNEILLNGKHISEYIGISDEALKELTSFTLNYLNDPKANLNIQMEVKGKIREIYTDDEKLHMEDVRKLNLSANYILLTSLCILLIGGYYFNKKELDYRSLYLQYKKGIIFTLFIFTFIAFFIFVDFDSFWTLFHKIFFRGNELWLLDLSKDILIMIVPPEFFNHLVVKIVLDFIILILGFDVVLKILSLRKSENND